MIKVSTPKFVKTYKYLRKAKRLDPKDILDRWGERGVVALSRATPMDTGETAFSWSYKIKGDKNRYVLSWSNDVMAGSVPLVILLQYGHATKSGWFIAGRNFINPALDPIFEGINRELVNEVVK